MVILLFLIVDPWPVISYVTPKKEKIIKQVLKTVIVPGIEARLK